VKKSIFVPLALLLLAACAAPAPEVTPSAPRESAPPSAPAPTETPPPPTASPQLIAGYPDIAALPELSPFTLEEIYARWYDETPSELLPRGDYGDIYPFVGALGYEYGYYSADIYGLCTADGKIICNPVFMSPRCYSFDGEEVYVLRKSTEKSDKKYLAATDGSYVYAYDEILSGGEGTFTVRTGGQWGSVDFRGRELLPRVYGAPVFFSEGLAFVWKSGETDYGYVNRNGEPAFEPRPFLPEGLEDENPLYRKLQDAAEYEDWRHMSTFISYCEFSDGRAVFFAEDKYGDCEGTYGYMDTRGKTVIEPVFPVYYVTDYNWDVCPFQDGLAVVRVRSDSAKYDRTHAVIDKNGAAVIPPEDGVSIVRYDSFFRLGADWSNRIRYADLEGNIVLYADDARFLEDGWFAVKTDGSVSLYKDGETYCELPPDASVWDVSFIGDDRFTLRRTAADGSRVSTVIDSGGNVIEELGADQYYESPWNIFRGKHAVQRGSYGGLLDENGEWLVKVSLLDSIPD
jgi:hypothetical protein